MIQELERTQADRPVRSPALKSARRKHGTLAKRGTKSWAGLIGLASAAAAVAVATVAHGYALQISDGGFLPALRAVLLGPSDRLTPASIAALSAILAAAWLGPDPLRRFRA